jgi:tetratricopeptide (TPR) repeat protein
MAAAEDRSSGGWLYGPATDLFVGCGLASVLVLAAQSVAGPSIAGIVPGAVLVLGFSLPHYGATLVRVYESAEDRRRYSFFAVYTSLGLAALFVVGLHSVLVGSLILTLYLTWSPWHYTGQNYGIFLMMLGRRGVPVPPLTKRLIYASFVFCFAITFFAIHGAGSSGDYAPVSYDNTVYHLVPLGIPASITGPVLWIVGAGYVVSVVGALAMLLRQASLKALGPSLMILFTQALWFSVPVALKSFGPGPESASLQSMYGAYGFLWIAAAHAAQYLWITTYYATRSDESDRPLIFLARSAMAGFAIWTLPALIFAPGLLGRLPHESGLALMVAAMVNLHHFILDGAIWKLRDGRLARILMPRGDAATGAEPIVPEPLGRPWLRTTLQALGIACILYGLVTLYEEEFGFERALARGDLARARQAVEHFEWLGRDGPTRRARLGIRYASLGELQPAERELQRSLALHPSFEVWQALGRMREERQAWRPALAAYEEALLLRPDHPATLYRSGAVWLELGRPDRALPLLELAVELNPRQGQARASLLRARREFERAKPGRDASDARVLAPAQ